MLRQTVHKLSQHSNTLRRTFATTSSGCPFHTSTSTSTPRPAMATSTPKCPVPHGSYGNPVNPYAGAKPMTPEQIAIVKSTAPIMAQYGETITRHFYKRMFGKNPQLNNVFNRANQATGEQPRALAAAVHAYAANIDNLGALGDAVNKIAQKHCSLNITADQYTIVGENLIASVAEVLGAALDQKTAEAWIAAYAQLANILIGAEAKLYREAAAVTGGWNGWRKFIVHKKVQESNVITSFYLRPADGQVLPTFQPGQYISIKMFVQSLGYEQPRQYSLTHIPATSTDPECYRISVKRESHTEKPAGVLSNIMHDTVNVGDELDVSHPMGEFILGKGNNPVVLISGGVGLTPMVSMLPSLINSKRPTLFLHGARDSQHHAMRQYITSTSQQHPHITKQIWYQHVNEGDVKSRDYDHTGDLNLKHVAHLITPILNTADFYICGPTPFMLYQTKVLADMGVDASRVHTELFGTGANP